MLVYGEILGEQAMALMNGDDSPDFAKYTDSHNHDNNFVVQQRLLPIPH